MMDGFVFRLQQAGDAMWIGVLRWGYPDFPLWVLGLVALSILLGWPGARPHDEKASHHTLWWRIRIAALGAAILAVSFAFLYRMLAYRVLPPETAAALVGAVVDRWWILALTVPALAVVLRVGFVRYGRPWLSAKLRDARVRQHTEALSDIRDEVGRWDAVKFAPRSFYRSDQVFTAVNDSMEPVHIPVATFLETNKVVIGATRYGKGVTFQSWADQAIVRGDAVWMIDPKGDEFLPAIMRARAKELGRPFVMIDLRDDGFGTWSPLEHGTLEERRTRMVELLNLAETGTNADHYKILAAGKLLEAMENATRSSLSGILAELGKLELTDKEDEALASPREKLKRLSKRRGLTPRSGRGLNTEDALTNGAIVYIVGSLSDGDIKLATRLILRELVDTATRLKKQRTAPLSIFVDELKFLASDTITGALATALGGNINITVAFQSFGDMAKPDDVRLDGDAVLQSVLTNCQLKLIFGGTDAATAEWVAKASGTVRKRVAKLERTKVGALGGEVWEDQRTLGEEEEALIPENVTLTLPRGRAVMFQPGQLATVVQVAPIHTPETEAVVAAKLQGLGLALPAPAAP